MITQGKHGRVELRSHRTGRLIGDFKSIQNAREKLRELKLRKKLRSRQK